MIYLNSSPINITLFSDNTSQVWKLPENTLYTTNYASIMWDFEHEGEFMHLAQLKKLLDHNLFTTTLRLKYLPYARQDKEVSNTTTFALRVFAEQLNSLKFEEVVINDPHSDVALKLIEHSRATYPTDKILKIAQKTGTHHLCYPDSGALKKYSPMFDMSAIWGEKVRDQLTGNITSYKLIGRCENQNILIVDDLIDGGMTFILLTKELLKAGANEVNLFATHGIFSKGVKPLFDSGIKRIFTTDGEVGEVRGSIVYEKM